jgi:hypothetical protein
MFMVSADEATAIRSAWITGGEFSAAVELRRLFPGIEDMAKALECARIIAGWLPSPPPAPATVTRLKPKRRPTG